MLGNIGNLLGDLDFWGGVATGVGEQIDIQEERKDRDFRELRRFGMERTLQISEENAESLNNAEKQVQELAALVAGDRSANSPEAMEAAFYLIDKHGGVAGATSIASMYNKQYTSFGIDPITEMGLESRTDAATITPRAIASTFTKLKPLPNISESPIGTQRTALDVIFGRKSAEEIVGEEMKGMFDTTDQTAAAISPVSADPTDERFIIGSNYNVEKGTLLALQAEHRKVPEQNRDEEWKRTDNLIRGRLTLLRDATKPEMGESQRRTTKGSLLSALMASYNLKADFDINMMYRDAGTHSSIYRKADKAVSRMTTLLLEAVNNGYVGIGPNGEQYDPREFVESFGAVDGKHIIKVIPEDGSDPYLSVGDTVFSSDDMKTSAWKSSVILDGENTTGTTAGTGVPATPAIGGSNNAASGASASAAATGPVIPDSLINGLVGNMPGQPNATAVTRKANANAIMTIIKRNNAGKSQADLEAIFKSSTGVDWAEASK